MSRNAQYVGIKFYNVLIFLRLIYRSQCTLLIYIITNFLYQLQRPFISTDSQRSIHKKCNITWEKRAYSSIAKSQLPVIAIDG